MASQLVARERVVPVAERTNPGGFVGRRPSGARNGNAVSSDEETDTSSHEEEETAEGTSRDEDDVRETLDCLVDAATESSGVSDDETDTERTMTDTPGSSESTNASWEVVAPEASASQRKPSTKKKTQNEHSRREGTLGLFRPRIKRIVHCLPATTQTRVRG